MKWEKKGNLRLGSNVIELMLPQRRPFLMVDFVDTFSSGAAPALEAGRHVSANEAYFGGHFPGLYLWPGTLTIEGLGQTAALLMTVLALRRAAEASRADPDQALDPLRNLDLGFRLHPGYRAQDAEDFLQRLRTMWSVVAVGAAVEIKFLKPVFAGQRLDYRVVLTSDFGEMVRFDVEACVDETPVAAGVLTGARVSRPLLPTP